MSRCYIYTRISEDPIARQTGRSVNCATQEADCRKLAASRGSDVVGVFTDGDTTAADPAIRRPDFESLLEGVLAGECDEVIVYTQDRFVRLPADIERVISAFTVAGVSLVPVTGVTDFSTPEGKLYARFNTLLGSYEVEKVRVRVRRKMAALAEDGLKPAGAPGYGYELLVLPDRRKTLAVAEHEASVIREMAERVLGGEALHAIAQDLNTRGVPTRFGSVWRAGAVKKILLSDRVAGRRVHRGEPVGVASWPAILDPATCASLARVLTDPARKASLKPRTTRMLTGVAECGRCGLFLNHAPNPRPGATDLRKYYCRHCHGTLISAQRLEELVRDRLIEALDGDDLAAAHRATTAGDGGSLVDEIGRLDAELAALAADYGAGSLTRDEWQAARSGLTARRRAAAADLDRLAAQRTSSPWLGRGADLRAMWADLSDLDRREAVRAVFARIVVGPATRGRNRFDPSRVSVEYRV